MVRSETSQHRWAPALRKFSAGRRSFGQITMNIGLNAVLLGVLAVVTARHLGATDRGVVVVFLTLTNLLMITGTLGTNTYGRARMAAPVDPLVLSDYLGLTWLLLVFDCLLVVTIGAGVLAITDSLTSSAVLPLLVVYSVMNLYCRMVRDALYAFGRNLVASRSDAVAAASQLGLVIAVAWLFGLGLERTLVCLVLGQATQILYLLRQMTRAQLPLTSRFVSDVLRKQIRGGLPALSSILAQTFMLRIDRLLLGAFASTSLVGVYSVGVTFTEVLVIVPLAMSQVLFRRVASGTVQPQDLLRLRVVTVAISVSTATVVGIGAPLVVEALFGTGYLGAVAPMRILLIGSVFLGSYLVDITIVNASGNLGAASKLTALGFLVVVALDLVLIPTHSMIGAATASAIGYTVLALSTAAYVQRSLRRAPYLHPEHRVSGEGG